MTFPLAAFLALFSAVLVLIARVASRQRKVFVEGLPEVPGAHWLFGHFPIFRKVLNSGEFEAAQRTLAYDHANSDGVCTFRMLGRHWIALSDPQIVRSVLTAAHHRETSTFQMRHGSKMFGRKNILSMRGREWRFWRATVHRAFTPAALKGMQSRMVVVASTLVESIVQRIDDEGQQSMDVEELCKMVTLDVFGLTALGVDFRSCHTLTPSPIATAFDFLSSELLRRIKTMYLPTSHFYYLPTEANRRHKRESAVLRNVLDEAVKSRRQQQQDNDSSDDVGEDDLLAHLFRAVDGTTTNVDVSDETFSDMLMGLLFAGYETTSVTLTYCLYCLAKNPDVAERAVEEIDAVLGSAINSSHVKPPMTLDPDQLPYCRAVITETLRLYPPAIHTFRTLDEPLEISNCTVPKGTQVFIPIWAIQRDANIFPKAEEFIPERWATQAVEKDGESGSKWRERQAGDVGADGDVPPGDRNAFLSFSGGARSCVGRKFAMQESVIILAIVLRSLKFEVDDDYTVEPFRAGLIQTPRGGMPMKISRRS